MIYPCLLGFLVLVYFRPQDFIPALAAVRPVFVLLGVTGAAWSLDKLSTGESRFLRSRQDWFVVMFCGLAVFSTWRLGWLTYTYETGIFFSKIVLIYVMIADVVNSEKRLVTFALFLTGLTMLVAWIALLQVKGIDLLNAGILYDPYTDLIRVQGAGLFQNPNYLAYGLAIWLPVMIVQIVSPEFSRGARAFSLIALVSVLACIYHTHSRGGYLCAFVTVSLALFDRIKGGRKVPLMVLLGAGFMGMMGLGRMVGLAHYTRDASAMDRIDMWYTCIDYFKQYPLFGLGFELFREEYKRPAHSGFATVAAEMGFAGLVAWAGMLWCGFRDALSLRDDTVLGEYGKALYVGVLSYCAAAMFANIQYIIPLFLLLAMVSALRRIRTQTGEKTVRENPRLEIGGAIAGAAGILIMLHLVVKFSS